MLFQRRREVAVWQRHIDAFFKHLGANAIGTHGTASGNFESIRVKGLWSKNEDTRFTYYRMSRRDILKILKKSGRIGLLRQFVTIIDANLGAFEDSKLPHIWDKGVNRRFPLTHYGLVVGKTDVRFQDDLLTRPSLSKPGLWGFHKDNLLLTLRLSPKDVAELAARYGTDHFISNDPTPEAVRLRRAVAFRLARKMLMHFRAIATQSA